MRQDKKQPLLEHLEELRRRILLSVACVFLAACVFYNFVERILPYLLEPVGRVVFIAPTEAFVTHVKIALFGGLFLSSPFVIYQIWKFVSMGLAQNERKYIMLFAPASFLFFISGACFGYLVILPIGMKFLLSFGSDYMLPMITVSKYITFVGVLTLAFGVVFELPLVILFLTKIGLVTPEFLSRRRRHAIVLIFIVAALLTPPDVVTQVLMAGPLLVLYEISILFSRWAYKPITTLYDKA